jgi:molybdenum cofactor biosynthesis enzyme MoaA
MVDVLHPTADKPESKFGQAHWSGALRQAVRSAVRNRPRIKSHLVRAEASLGLLQHTAAQLNSNLVKARPRRLTVAITAHCNLRCVGCRYGRDFMSGEQLPLQKVKELLDDAKAAGVELVRLYGGEPLLHPDLPDMVRHAVKLGLSVYVTTNGILLKQKIDALYEAGLRNLTIGYYGTGKDYDEYVQRGKMYRRLEEAVATIRERYGSAISLQLNFLIMRPSCNLDALHAAWNFAKRFDMTFHTDLIHYSLPYFTEGPNRELQFTDADADDINALVTELAKLSSPIRRG